MKFIPKGKIMIIETDIETGWVSYKNGNWYGEFSKRGDTERGDTELLLRLAKELLSRVKEKK